MSYSFQTFSLEQVLTSAQMNQVEANVRDHIHGRSGVLRTGISWPRTAKTAAFTALAADVGELFDITSGTFTVSFDPAATLGAGWAVTIANTGSGQITLDPDSTETIDGETTKTVFSDTTLAVWSDGTNLHTGPGGGGAWRLIETQVASNDANLSFTTGITTIFETYAIVWSAILSASIDQVFVLVVSTDGGSTYLESTDYDKAGQGYLDSGARDDEGAAPGVTHIQLGGNVGATASEDVQSGILYMNHPRTSALITTFYGNMFHYRRTDEVRTRQVAARTIVADDVDAIRLQMSGGANLVSGRVSLFGIAHR